MELGDNIPRSVAKLKEKLGSSGWGGSILEWLEEPNGLIKQEQLRQIIAHAPGVFSNTLGLITLPVVILVLAAYLAAEPRLYIQGLVKLIPQARRARAQQLIAELGHTLRWWLFGQGISMLVLGLSTGLLLWLLDIPLALLLAIFTAFMTFIPNIGPVISGIPTVLIAFAESPWKAALLLRR